MTMTSDEVLLENVEGNLIPVFVYGTLRVGQGNFRWAQEAVRHVLLNCTTKGRIYFVHGRRGFPVAKLDEEGTILGDVLWFDPQHPDFDGVVSMELGAGYEMKDVTVTTEDGELEACAFHYIWDDMGEWIRSGDWVSEANRRIT